MLRDSLFKYYYFKLKFLVIKQKFNRNPLDNPIKDLPFKCTIGELINFVSTKLVVVDVEVEYLHDKINWNKFFEKKSRREKNKLDDFHMRLVVNASLEYPIILKSDSVGNVIGILDGYHRLKKAYLLKKKTIKSYIVPLKDLNQLKLQNDEKI